MYTTVYIREGSYEPKDANLFKKSSYIPFEGDIISGTLRAGMRADISGKPMALKALAKFFEDGSYVPKFVKEAHAGDRVSLAIENVDPVLLISISGKEITFSDENMDMETVEEFENIMARKEKSDALFSPIVKIFKVLSFLFRK